MVHRGGHNNYVFEPHVNYRLNYNGRAVLMVVTYSPLAINLYIYLVYHSLACEAFRRDVIVRMRSSPRSMPAEY